MKKIVIGSVLSLASICLLAPQALAVESKAETETTAGFKAGGGENPVTPGGENPIIDPVGPKPDPIDGISLIYYPTISFGTDNAISTSEVNYNAFNEQITIKKTQEKYFSPHFVQVADASGKNTKWDVLVSQKDVYTKGNNTDKLNNTRIRINGNTLTSTDDQKLANITGINLSPATKKYAQIPVATKSEQAISIISHEASTNVSGGIYSSVFAKDYQLSNYFDGEKAVNKGTEKERYDGVQLNVPKGEDVKKNTTDSDSYKAQLVWTLSVAP